MCIRDRAAHGNDWLRMSQQADANASQLPAQAVPLAYAASKQSRPIDFRGYEYTRTHSAISGALMTRYDETKPQVWRIPLRDDLLPSVSVQPPSAGYVVPAAHAAWVGTCLLYTSRCV